MGRTFLAPGAFERAMSVVTALHHAGFPGSVVAGGFLRDSALGVPPKDMDVFIPAADHTDTRDLERVLSKALGVPIVFECDVSYGEDPEIARVLGQKDGASCPVQVIEMARGIDPKGRAPRFDFGFCQATVCLPEGLWVSEAFERDLANRTGTLVWCEDAGQHARSMRRWNRWKSTHPVLKDFTLVDNTTGDFL